MLQRIPETIKIIDMYIYIYNFQTNRKQLNKENLINPKGSSEEENLKKQRTGTPLLVQWLRPSLPLQGVQVCSLVRS